MTTGIADISTPKGVSVGAVIMSGEMLVNSPLKSRSLLVTCGASFDVVIVSEQFEGKRLLDRHRLVNATLEEEMKEIHALSIKKAVTPEQWKQQQEAGKA